MNNPPTKAPSFSNAELTWDDDGLPHSTLYGDIYYSKADAIGESEHVFINGNNLAQRWQKNNLSTDHYDFVIAECGFGSGLNFLTTCKLWCETSPENARLHYIAFENHPLLQTDLAPLLAQWPHLRPYTEALLEQYIDHSQGLHRIKLTINAKQITLDLHYGDALQSLQNIHQVTTRKVDAWFLDGFSPKLNPQMWCHELFQSIADLSGTGTTLSTYSVAGEIRRGLIAVGFAVNKSKGFAHKRHMLTALFSKPLCSPKTPKALLTKPWLQLPESLFAKPQSNQSQAPANRAAVIGAGMAGCATAFALAQRGWHVTLIERQAQVASQASGNSQGIVHCKINQAYDAPTQFMLQSFLYAIRHYQAMAKTDDIHWHQCGMIQLAYNEQVLARQQNIISKGLYSKRCLKPLSVQQSNNIAGFELNLPGLFLADSGWLNPTLLCAAYCRHPAINLHLHTEVSSIQRSGKHWQITTQKACSSDATVASSINNLNSTFDAVVIANSIDAEKLDYCQHYPLIPNRGQVDTYSSTATSSKLSTILCSNGYIVPNVNNENSIGGSFSANNRNNKVSVSDLSNNLQLLKGISPRIHDEFSQQPQISSRASLRSSTPDYLPIIGPVENYQSCKKLYAALALNAKKVIPQQPHYHNGLYVNLAHGSHGLTTTPIAAEYIAAMLSGDPLPLQNDLIACLHPLRFLIRNIKKQI